MSEPETHPFYVFRNAAFFDRIKAATLLKQNPALLEVRSPHVGETVLHWAAVENEWEVIAWLLERGANINCVNDFGCSALMNATTLEYETLCAFLVDNGANVGYINDSENAVERSALEIAASRGYLAIVQLFLRHIPADNDINRYFDDYEAAQILYTDSAVATRLRERGLQNRWDE